MSEKLKPLIAYLDRLTSEFNLEDLGELLARLDISQYDISDYCEFGENTYKRNLVSSSEWYDLLVMCWKSGQASQIHDHLGSACGFKVVTGQASEIIYEHLSSGYVRPLKKNLYVAGDVGLAWDSDTHKISNENSQQNLVTLHVYSPKLHMNFYELDPAYANVTETQSIQFH